MRRWTAAGVIALANFLLLVNPRYVAYLDDEFRFQEAIRQHTLAFFPGYVGFLETARALMGFVSDAAALQLISSFFGSLAVATFWLWLTREGLRLPLAALGTLVFATGVYQLFNASVGTTYTVEAFAFLAVGYCCTDARRDPRLLYAAAVVLAVAGAYRQTTPFFLAPLFLWSAYRARALRPVLLAGGLSLAWVVPTLLHFGGAGHTVAAGASQVQDAVLPSTLLSGPKLAAANLLRFVFYLAFGAHILLLFALPALRGVALLWLAPAALFYALVYVSWPGYVLGVLAGLVFLGVRQIAHLPRAAAYGILTAICVTQLCLFYLTRPIPRPSNMASAIASTYGLQYSKWAIEARFQARLRDVVAKMQGRGGSQP